MFNFFLSFWLIASVLYTKNVHVTPENKRMTAAIGEIALYALMLPEIVINRIINGKSEILPAENSS